MIKRMTKRYYRAEKIRDNKHYKMLKHLLYYVRYKSVSEIILKMWQLKHPNTKLFLSSDDPDEDKMFGRIVSDEYKDQFVDDVLNAIFESNFKYDLLIRFAKILYSDSWHMNNIVKQIGLDELPKEAFLFNVADRNDIWSFTEGGF